MTDYTTVDNTANGGRIKYLVNSGGYVSINVVSAGLPINLAVGTGSSFNAAAALSEALVNLDYRIAAINNDIKSTQAQITNLNTLLSKPNLSSELRTQYQNDIADAQKELVQSQTSLVTAQEARSSLNTIGGSTLQALIGQAREANTAAQTAKPTPVTNSTTTTTTNGPTTTTQTKTTTITANAKTTTTTVTSSKTTSSAKTLTGAASDDSGAKQPNTAGSTGAPKASPAAAAGAGGSGAAKSGTGATNANPGGTGASTPTNAKAGPYQFKASIISNQPVATASQPGKRLRNPLGEFSSYTYQLTLYMITPDAYEAFIQSGRTKLNVLSELGADAGATGGAFVIAQSGGVNNASEKRAPGFTYDYGIDNLKIMQALPGKGTGTSATISEITFNITEQYGFSFLSNLRKASDALMEYASGLGKGPENPGRQFFILGIKFLGYDASGRIMQPNTKMATNGIDPTGNTATEWGVVDPRSQSGSLFEYFLDIQINEIHFKVEGKAVTYNIIAAQNTGAAVGFSTSRGTLQKSKTVEADTVAVALDQLADQLNQEQATLAKGDKPALRYPNKYEIVWLPGTEDILNASVISAARFEKLRWKGSGATSSKESNAGTEVNTQSASNVLKTFQFSAGKPIIELINEVIKNSSYLEDALKVLYTSNIESDPVTKSEPVQKPSYQKQSVSWYSCTPQISEIQWDDIVKSWSYKISYLIGKFQTPVVDTPVVAGGKNYYGPHKRYDYWYTGENREIISYQQTNDQTYMNVVLDGNAQLDKPKEGSGSTTSGSGDQPASTGSQTPSQPNMQTNLPKVGSTGYGLEVQNNYLTALLDPGAYSTAEINIMGDPDYLISEPVYSQNQVFDQFYGSDTFSINPAGGQVYIEIDFKEAVDYTSETGTLNINESILFYKYPENISKKIKGVSYTLTDVESTFSGGTFKQKLTAAINEFGQDAAATSTATGAGQQREAPAANSSSTTSGPTPGNSTKTSTQTTGTKADPAPKTNPAPAASSTPPKSAGNATVAQPTVQTKTGPVANDDGSLIQVHVPGLGATPKNAAQTWDAGRPPKIELPGLTPPSLVRIDLPGSIPPANNSPTIRGITI